MPGAAADPVRISNDKQLEMAVGSGLYAFTNLQSLWISPTVALNEPVYPLAPRMRSPLPINS